jgi:hypothetical protein
MAAGSARLYSEAQDDRSAAHPGRGPALALVPPALPKFALRCRWEYLAAEGRIVQIWETRPE